MARVTSQSYAAVVESVVVAATLRYARRMCPRVARSQGRNTRTAATNVCSVRRHMGNSNHVLTAQLLFCTTPRGLKRVVTKMVRVVYAMLLRVKYALERRTLYGSMRTIGANAMAS